MNSNSQKLPPTSPHFNKDIAMLKLNVNTKESMLDLAPDTPVLWALRDGLGLSGTKYGCGVAQCGACTVHVDGQAIRSCITPVSTVAGRKITTIEAIAKDKVGKAVQAAWIAHDVAQCGYCQSGQIMSATALMSGNICRCGTYQRIRGAIKAAAAALA
jgi:isoquinoline 1-oxidoreductase alpha subunit